MGLSVKLFDLLQLQWSSGVCSAVVQLVEYWTRNREVAGSTHTRSTASDLEQVANLLCARANSASYPQRDGKWVVSHTIWATRWRPRVADWAMVCLLAAPWVQLSVSTGNGWLHNALRYHRLMLISCHLWGCKALLVTSLDSCKRRRYNKCPDSVPIPEAGMLCFDIISFNYHTTYGLI